MRSKAIAMVLLAFAFETLARPVSQTEAVHAVSAWSKTSGVVGNRLTGASASSVRHVTADGIPFYTVKMEGGGTVFTSADTRMEPVIAFSSSANDFSEIDDRGPLWALLNRDLQVRQAVLSGTAPRMLAVSVQKGEAVSVSEGNEAKWAKLLSVPVEAAEGGALAPNSVSTAGSGTPGDLRVDRLVQSTWDQADAGGGYHVKSPCYNYYTPTSATQRDQGNVANAVCGCVATAMAQVMRYHEFPSSAIDPVTRSDCYFDKTKISLTMQGGLYDWTKMTLKPESSTPQANRQAIGKLTSDAGISVGMMYSRDDSGSWSAEARNALSEVFGYRQARMYNGKYTSSAAQKVMYANFDAGFPVILGISGSGGHEVVGDGYGYNGDTAYVHLNMGWSGSSDLWYNLPNIGTTYDFSVIGEIIYNIMPSEDGAILSGRIRDDDGKALPGVTVHAYKADTAEEVGCVQADAHGIYAFVLPAGRYDVEIDVGDGKCADKLMGIVLNAPDDSAWTGYGKLPDGGSRKLSTVAVSSIDKTGNSWGNDISLVIPTVQIETEPGVKTPYSRLDKALAAAREIAVADPSAPVVVEVISDTELRQAFTIDFPCEIRSEGGAFTVKRRGGAGFTVADGGSLLLEDIAFSMSVVTLADVLAGGRFILGDGVDMGIGGIDLVAVRTADDAGFTLAATLETGFAIDCATAHGAGARFGRVDPGLSPEEAATSAAKIVNIHDAFGEIRGKVDSDGESLVWAEIPVPFDEAVGYYVDVDGVTNTAARLDRLFPKFMAALNDGTVGNERELVITESGSLSNCCFTGRGNFTVRGGAPDLVISNSAGVAQNKSTTSFTVTDGVMTIRNLAFEGFSGSPFVTVNGADAGLALGRGAVLRNIACATGASPVTVKKGTCLMTEDAAIIGCKSETSSGGGVCLEGTGCALTMNGGVISNCSAKQNGGGVYANVGAAVSLAGPVVICDNLSGNSQPQQDDDLYLNTGVRVTLASSLDGGRVGIRAYESAVNKGKEPFARGEVGGLELETTARTFFKDRDTDGLVAVAEGASLKWGTAEEVPEHQPLGPGQEALAYAKVTYGGRVEYWESALWLFEALSNYTGTAVVELLKDDFFDANVTIRGKLTLQSSGGDWSLARKPDVGICVQEGASFAIGNVTLKGVYAEDDEPSGKPLIKAIGGEVMLKDGARIEGVLGDSARDAGAVTIWKGGTFRMESGSEIYGCTNLFVDVGEGASNGGAVLIDNESKAYLHGGRIVGCAAYKGGGVSVANKSEVHVGNDMTIGDNTRLLDGSPNNLQVHDLSLLYLDAKLTGRIGYVKGVGGDGEIFGQVADSFEGTPEDMAASARLFSNDETGDIGAAVADAQGTTLLVWCDAVAPDGTFVRDDVEYHYIEGGELLPVAPPVAVSGLSYRKGVEQVGVEPGVGYALSGNVAVDAGTYQATATLRRGFAWEDGDDQPKTVEWSIAKAVISLDGVTFTGATFVFDGQPHYIRIAGSLPDGVKVRYENNDKSAVGTYLVKAIFTAEDADNCVLSVSEMTADLVITDQPVPPPPPPPPVPETNNPTPIAFQSIRFDTDAGEWELVATNGVKDCWYSLWGGTELKLNERGLIGTEVVAPAQADADGPVIFRVAVPDTDRQWFWRALAEPGEVRPEE